MLKYLFILFFSVMLVSNLQAQKSIHGLYAGYTWQNNHVFDIGYRKSWVVNDVWWKDIAALYVGSEIILPRDGQNLITGFNIGISRTVLVIPVVSFQTIYYTDFTDLQLGFRPEIGIGSPHKVSLSYGYNFLIV